MLQEVAKIVDRMVEENRLDEITDSEDRLLVMRTFADHLPGVKIQRLLPGGQVVDDYNYGALDWESAKRIIQDLSSRERIKKGVHPT